VFLILSSHYRLIVLIKKTLHLKFIMIYCSNKSAGTLLKSICNCRVVTLNDVSRAFSRIRVDNELSRWLVDLVGLVTLLVTSGVVGISPFAAFFHWLYSPFVISVNIQKKRETHSYWSYLKHYRRTEKSRVEPCQGLLGDRSLHVCIPVSRRLQYIRPDK